MQTPSIIILTKLIHMTSNHGKRFFNTLPWVECLFGFKRTLSNVPMVEIDRNVEHAGFEKKKKILPT